MYKIKRKKKKKKEKAEKVVKKFQLMKKRIK